MAISPSLKDNPNLDQWIAIAADGTVRVRSGKVDLGQRISTALAVIAGEELNIDPARIVIESPDTRNDPDEGMTTGSNSMQHSGNALRCAAATAKRVLLDKAAAHFETGVDQLTFDDGLIGVAGTNRSISLGELAGGEPFGVPVDPDAAVKAPADYRWIGQAFAAYGGHSFALNRQALD
ncbi:MAG: molybdopterin cofactor-binding domain-containing protein, partial [Rhodospirillaceae bacterium]